MERWASLNQKKGGPMSGTRKEEDELVEKSRKLLAGRLFDLSLRNPLLNFRERKSSTLRMVSLPLDRLLSLTQSEKGLLFPTDSTLSEKENDEEKEVLKRLERKSRDYFSETGLWVLFLSFGLLSYPNPDPATAKGETAILSAPLLLLPVRILFAPEGAKLLAFEEPYLNPTLSYRLKQSFGYVPKEWDGGKLSDYFQFLSSALPPSFKLDSTAELSLLPYPNMSLYEDVEKNAGKIDPHPILRPILLGKEVRTEKKEYPLDDEEARKEEEDEILDADPSQREAILAARHGESFVLEGPPGTGKSQTIANLIAQSIHQGKKVLFVAQKKAALDVVYRRLKEAGLSDFVLNLSSSALTPKTAVESLMESLRLAENRYALGRKDVEDSLLRLEDEKKLEGRRKELLSVRGAYGISLFELYGEIYARKALPSLSGTVSKPRAKDRATLRKEKEDLARYGALYPQDVGAIRKNPFYESREDFPDEKRAMKFRGLVRRMDHAVASLLRILASVKEVSLPTLSTLKDVEEAERILQASEELSLLPGALLIDPALKELKEDLSIFPALKMKYQNALERFKEDEPELRKLTVSLPLLGEGKTADVQAVAGFEEEIDERRKKGGKAFEVWTDNPGLLLSAKALLPRVEEEHARILQAREGVLSPFVRKIEEEDLSEIAWAYKNAYVRKSRFLLSGYRKDRKRLKAYLRHGAKLPDYAGMLEAFQGLEEIKEAKSWFRNNHEALAEAFGREVSAEDDPAFLGTDLMLFERMRKVKADLLALKEADRANDALRETLSRKHGFSYEGYDLSPEKLLSEAKEALAFRKLLPEDGRYLPFLQALGTGALSSEERRKVLLALSEGKESLLSYDGERKEFKVLSGLDLEGGNLTRLFHTLEGFIQAFPSLALLRESEEKRSRLKEEGLLRFLKAAEESHVPGKDLAEVYEKSFDLDLAEALVKDSPFLSEEAKEGKDLVEEFRLLDYQALLVARKRIYAESLNALPRLKTTEEREEALLLRRENAKKHRCLKLRELFSRLPHLLLSLKPVLMMSPLSVSTLLDADLFSFDLVLFDEASQVLPENALGAIYRGRQVILAGDRKQLPPTTFYQVLGEEEESPVDGFDSILSLAQSLPSRMLLFHYRSQDESLIRFSNERFYQGKLVTFPGIPAGKRWACSRSSTFPTAGIRNTRWRLRTGRRGSPPGRETSPRRRRSASLSSTTSGATTSSLGRREAGPFPATSKGPSGSSPSASRRKPVSAMPSTT